MVVLRKVNAVSVVICRLIKRSIMQIKKIQGEKLIQTVIFLKLPSAYEVLIKRNVKCSAYIFLHQKRVKQVIYSDRLVEALTP